MTREEALSNYYEGVIANLADQQVNLGLFASGKSISSLQYEIKDDGTSTLTGDASFYYQIHGRGPGKMPPIGEMIKWIAIKQIQMSPWALAVKIKNEGTAIFRGERRGLDMKKALNTGRNEMVRNLAKAYKEEIINKIKDATRNT
jgi:hypothetical protein